MYNVLFYGNCQLTSLKSTLNLNNVEYNQTIIECFNTEIIESDFLNCINTADIIIMNLVEDNYRNKFYLSTTYIIYHAKENCRIILLNNFHFSFYYVDELIINNTNMSTPYHHNYLFECYKNNQSADYYINNYVNNKNLKTKYELECVANKSFEELDKRYEIMLLHKQMSPHKLIYTLPICQYIKDNYKEKLLFYTINHPSKYIFQYISEQILHKLNIENTINYEMDLLNTTRCILYTCIQKVVLFDIKKETPLIFQKNNVKDITNWYYEFYKTNSSNELQ